VQAARSRPGPLLPARRSGGEMIRRQARGCSPAAIVSMRRSGTSHAIATAT
jgi:hypothetical protein